jgi:hypothetical protein
MRRAKTTFRIRTLTLSDVAELFLFFRFAGSSQISVYNERGLRRLARLA